MELRYSEGRTEVASLDEALAILGQAPQDFSLIITSPRTGIKQTHYLTLNDKGQCVDTHTGDLFELLDDA